MVYNKHPYCPWFSSFFRFHVVLCFCVVVGAMKKPIVISRGLFELIPLTFNEPAVYRLCINPPLRSESFPFFIYPSFAVPFVGHPTWNPSLEFVVRKPSVGIPSIGAND